MESYITPPGSNESTQAPAAKTSFTVRPKVAELTSEQKARKALIHAIAHAGPLENYVFHKVIGFGANGVVIAAERYTATAKFEPVAIKLIYKIAKNDSTPPNEIKVLRAVANDPHRYLLGYIEDFQDAHSFILVTELFGTDWNTLAEDALKEDVEGAESGKTNSKKTASKLEPLRFKNPRTGLYTTVPFSSGCGDIWAWSYYERVNSWKQNHPTPDKTMPLLPLPVIKNIAFQVIRGMMHFHEQHGFFHGDIKAENVLVIGAPDNSKDYDCEVRICDFGHANSSSRSMYQAGTLENAPPELIAALKLNNTGQVFIDGTKADVFAVGIMILRLLKSSGVLDGRVACSDDVAVDLGQAERLLDRMTTRDPAQRPSMREALAFPWFHV
ncbi:MAP kinase kinase (MEK) [Physocladia obscura]|uniref:MAP kinase kinase (MEK) n=1 Tax=Physocladia obscura TaxID=109957 RepID=A0AAD5XFD3_9FUNG|nr:MAP kinase kinase (MEK) [Physocladia obscura]